VLPSSPPCPEGSRGPVDRPWSGILTGKKFRRNWMQPASVHTCLRFFPRVHPEGSNRVCSRKPLARSARLQRTPLG
jgi:hypothetical protein